MGTGSNGGAPPTARSIHRMVTRLPAEMARPAHADSLAGSIKRTNLHIKAGR